MYYSGGEKRGSAGVANVVDKNTYCSVMGYNPVNERIISARFNAKPVPITVIQCYAPTSAASEESIDDFYEHLQQTIDNSSTKDTVMVMGDFNAKVGDTTITGDMMGSHGLGTANECGRKLVYFCKENRLLICNTQFQQHPRRKYMWRSSNGMYRNQIDFITIQKRWKSSILKCRAYLGADCDSDHNLVMANWKTRLRKINREPPPTCFDLENLSSKYTTESSNHFAALAAMDDDDNTPEELWDEIKKIVLETAIAHVPKKKKVKKQPWVSNDTLERVKKRREALPLGRHSDLYKKLNKVVKKTCRRDKKAWIESKCSNLEQMVERNNSKGLFEQVKELKGEFTPRAESIKAKGGTVLTEDEQIKVRWLEYTKKLYKKDENVIQMTTELGEDQ